MITEDIQTSPPVVSLGESLGDAVVFGGSVTSSATVPDFIPADQAYFWSTDGRSPSGRPWRTSQPVGLGPGDESEGPGLLDRSLRARTQARRRARAPGM